MPNERNMQIKIHYQLKCYFPWSNCSIVDRSIISLQLKVMAYRYLSLPTLECDKIILQQKACISSQCQN